MGQISNSTYVGRIIVLTIWILCTNHFVMVPLYLTLSALSAKMAIFSTKSPFVSKTMQVCVYKYKLISLMIMVSCSSNSVKVKLNWFQIIGKKTNSLFLVFYLIHAFYEIGPWCHGSGNLKDYAAVYFSEVILNDPPPKCAV